jgi:hypothetical protein
MNLAFKLIFLEGDHNHSLGENIEKCLNDVIEAQKGRQKKISSLFYCLHCSYTETV